MEDAAETKEMTKQLTDKIKKKLEQTNLKSLKKELFFYRI